MLVAAGFLAGCGGAHAVPSSITLPANHPDAASRASSFTVLYSFRGGYDGGDPATALMVDTSGKLYGTTVIGGTYSCGTVFELTPQASPPWPETVLYDFDCAAHGKNPYGGVRSDVNGDFDGTTVAGGSGGSCSDGCGIAYRLAPSGETVLHNFTGGNDGFGPGSALVNNPGGNLFGTTPDGGSGGHGVVYEISPVSGGWHERVIHAFTGGSDGGTGSLGSLLIVGPQRLYGATETGGAYGYGTVFELRKVSRKWTLSTVHAFAGPPDGGSPYGGLIADRSANVYGTTYYGGKNNLGAVFKFSARGGGYTVLYSFRGGSDGSLPTSTPWLGPSGDLYGTTSTGGGKCGCGTIFAVDPLTGKETVLHRFSGTDGANPYYGLTQDASGNLYGTSVAGGTSGQGTVFEFKPSKPHEIPGT